MTASGRLSWKDVRDEIHSAILAGRYGPGDRLPRDADIADTFATIADFPFDARGQGFPRDIDLLPPEARQPRENFAFINEYLAYVEPCITDNGGFINQYYGDGIMALFEDADAALAAGREMLAALEDFNESHETIAIGIGLHTGEVMLGTIGDEARLDTGVIGDAVNTASRIQELTKEHGRALLLSGATERALAEAPALDEIATVTPKGKSEPITLFAISDEAG